MDDFDSLALPAELCPGLDALNLTTMTPIQSAALPDILAGRDVIAQERLQAKRIKGRKRRVARLYGNRGNAPIRIQQGPPNHRFTAVIPAQPGVLQRSRDPNVHRWHFIDQAQSHWIPAWPQASLS